MTAYSSIASEKIPPNLSRRFLFKVGAVNYAEAVRSWAQGHKAREEKNIPFVEITEEIKTQIDVKNPKQ